MGNISVRSLPIGFCAIALATISLVAIPATGKEGNRIPIPGTEPRLALVEVEASRGYRVATTRELSRDRWVRVWSIDCKARTSQRGIGWKSKLAGAAKRGGKAAPGDVQFADRAPTSWEGSASVFGTVGRFVCGLDPSQWPTEGL